MSVLERRIYLWSRSPLLGLFIVDFHRVRVSGGGPRCGFGAKFTLSSTPARTLTLLIATACSPRGTSRSICLILGSVWTIVCLFLFLRCSSGILPCIGCCRVPCTSLRCPCTRRPRSPPTTTRLSRSRYPYTGPASPPSTGTSCCTVILDLIPGRRLCRISCRRRSPCRSRWVWRRSPLPGVRAIACVWTSTVEGSGVPPILVRLTSIPGRRGLEMRARQGVLQIGEIDVHGLQMLLPIPGRLGGRKDSLSLCFSCSILHQ